MNVVDRKVFTGWVYITRAEDVPGCWVAHCLDFDTMSIGDSPQHALEMVREAVGLCLADDLNRDHDPHTRRADDDAWAPLLRLFERHTTVPVKQMDSSEFREFAMSITVVIVKTEPSQAEVGAGPDAKEAFAYCDAA